MQNNNVYECINISNVVNKLQLKKTNIIGNYMYVVCPFCQHYSDKNGYMKINTINNLYICDNCESTGTSIDLYAKFKYISTKEAFKQLLKEVPVLDNMPYTFNNPIKDEYYRDLVYRSFLNLQVLNKNHEKLLNCMSFTKEYIQNNNFKSIETRAKKKKDICKILQEQGYKLDGIPGFYQDTDFRWTYKSHCGIFIPVTLNNKIQGLRILLDSKYKLDTENIWFSSNNEYNGTKASNWPMVLKSENSNWVEMYNSKKYNSIIIATEMILAHKLFNNTNEMVIGIPNNVEKDVILNIVSQMKVKEVFLYADKYTILHTSKFMYQNIIESLEKQNIKVNFRVALVNENTNTDVFIGEENKKNAA